MSWDISRCRNLTFTFVASPTYSFGPRIRATWPWYNRWSSSSTGTTFRSPRSFRRGKQRNRWENWNFWQSTQFRGRIIGVGLKICTNPPIILFNPLGTTRKLVRGIWIGLTTNKLLLGGIIVTEIIIIILIVYLKWFKPSWANVILLFLSFSLCSIIAQFRNCWTYLTAYFRP